MNAIEHILVTLAEECNEVGQRVTKMLRFGVHEVQPGQELTNLQRLAAEYTDLVGTVEMLRNHGIDIRVSPQGVIKKQRQIEKFMRYAEEQGTLQR